MTGGWRLERTGGAAAPHHGRPLPEVMTRTVWAHEVTGPALVLGSTQPEEIVDRRAAADRGVEVARRRSGGGAVLLRPGAELWVDILLPAADPLWDDDVGAAARWVGEAWRAALADHRIAGAVHRGPMAHTDWSRLVCFAGRGPGEVFVEQAKVVGIAQRRTRAGARFQCAVPLSPWDPAPILDLLALGEADRRRGRQELAGAALGVGVPASGLLEALLDHLP